LQNLAGRKIFAAADLFRILDNILKFAASRKSAHSSYLMKPKQNVSSNMAGNDANEGDLFFLIAAAYFLSSLNAKTSALTSGSENDWTKQFPIEALKFAKHPHPEQILQDAAQLLCATQSKQEASAEYLAKILGADKNKCNFERAIKNQDAVAARMAFQERALFLLQFKEFRELNTPMLKKLLVRACETNDAPFLKQLGRKLSETPKSISDKQPEIIRILLLTFWNDPCYGQPLCRLTDDALTTFCELAMRSSNLNEKGVSFDQVQKTRQRLGLIKGPEPHFKEVRLDGDRISIS
jgi:hypothetical protein